MAEKIDMSLDDIIKANKKNKIPNRKIGKGNRNTNNDSRSNNLRSGKAGPVRNSFKQNRRSNPYSRPAPKTNEKWKHDLFDGNNKPAQLMVGNLHYRVTDTDIKELFAEFGVLKKAAVHYDKSGRSLGNAEVVFANRLSALKARDKYNDIMLDGRKMKITLVNDTKPSNPVAAGRVQQRKVLNNQGNRSQNKPKNGMNRPKNGMGRQKKVPKPETTKEQLDADLDAYVNKN